MVNRIVEMKTVDVEDEKGVVIPGEKMVRKFEFWDFLSLVIDETGIARGIVAQDLKSMAVKAETNPLNEKWGGRMLRVRPT